MNDGIQPFDLTPLEKPGGPWARRFGIASRVLAALIALYGVLAVAGWAYDLQTLKSFSPNGIIIKANTAIAMALAGLALLLLAPARRGPVSTAIGRLLAILAAGIGLATLSEHLFGWDLGIDQVLFREVSGEPATLSPGRMGPPASLCFPLIGLALLFLDRRPARGAAPSQMLAFTVILIAALPVLGYIYGVTNLFGIARLTGIAFSTAAALFLFGAGILMARPEVGPMRLLIAEDSGGLLARRMLPPAILMPAFLGYLRVLGEQAGFYDTQFGRTLLIFTFIVVFSVWIWRVGLMLSGHSAAQARAEAAQIELKDRLVRILENISQGFCALDLDGRCTYVNREAEHLTGRRRVEALGRPLEELYPERRYPELHSGIRRAAGTRQVVHVETRDDATGAWFDHDVVPTTEGVTLFTRDVTDFKTRDEERRRLLESEREARSVAEHSNRMKDEFLATLSHELRTPLNAILGWSMLLSRPGLPEEEAQRGLAAIERNSRLQARLIEDLLDMSRIVSGHVRLDLHEVHLEVVVDNVLLAVAPDAEARGIELTREVEPDAPAVHGDPARLQQVLWNLMSNALKFTPRHGRVRVTLKANGTGVELAVEDNGTGIAPEFMPHVFDRFRQADASTTRRHGGLGLGLAISRQLTELHGGTLTAQSEGPNRGSKFTVRLPVGSVTPDGRRPGDDGERQNDFLPEVSTLAGIRVLVVEDQPDTRELIAHILSARNAEVHAVGGHDAAVLALDRERFDVLVSDIGMPGRDGYALMRLARERFAAMPGIALTAFAREEDRRQAMAAGFRFHIPKPVQPERLVAAVARLARESAAAAIAPECAGPGAPPRSLETGFSAAALASPKAKPASVDSPGTGS